MAYMSSIIQSNGTMDIRSKPTFVLLGCCLLFDNMFICPTMCLTHLFALIWLSLILLLFACFLYLFVISIACLLAFFLVYCMYMHGVRMLGVRAQPPRCEQKGQGCKQEDAITQRAMISRLGGLVLPKWFSLSLSLSLFWRACIKVPPLLVPFTFPAPCLGHVPWVWQCLFYISCTLLGHTLGEWQCLVYFLVRCDSIVHDACFIYIYIYICLLVCGWLYTLYDGLLWLCERPFLVISALDLIVWVCAQGDCCRCIFMLYCVHDHRSVIVLIHVNKWHWFPRVCDMYQHVLTLWRASASHNASMSICDVYTDAKPCDAL